MYSRLGDRRDRDTYGVKKSFKINKVGSGLDKRQSTAHKCFFVLRKTQKMALWSPADPSSETNNIFQ